jgi:hypothetical protein
MRCGRRSGDQVIVQRGQELKVGIDENRGWPKPERFGGARSTLGRQGCEPRYERGPTAPQGAWADRSTDRQFPP